MTEEQLWDMSLRTFHNLLAGRVRKERAERKLANIKHSELVIAILSPHMKKKDREAAYKEIEREVKGLAPEKPKKEKKKINPVKFWEEIDKKTRGKGAPRTEG